MADVKIDNTRIYKASRDLVASKLAQFVPNLVGENLVSVGSYGDQTFSWRFSLSSVITTQQGVEIEDIQNINVSPKFLVEKLVNLLDPNIHPGQLDLVQIPESDPNRVWFHIRDVLSP